MRHGRAAAILLAAAAGTAAARDAPADRVVTGDFIVAATVNGQPGRLRIDPAAPAMPLIGGEWAARAGLKKSFIGIGYAVGPERVMGESAVARIAVGAAPYKRRVAWLKRRYDPAIDGVIGPGGLPDPVVRFVLRGARAGERVSTFRMVDEGGLMGGWGDRFAIIDVGGAPMRLRFDPLHPRTLATAGAGRRLADAYGGALDGAATREEIAFGIARPVRTMVLARPLAIGTLSVARLGVRTSDFGNAGGIAEAGAPPPDPDEVVVTAKGKRDPSRDRLALGADVLARCSSIVFDKRAKAIRLSCT